MKTQKVWFITGASRGFGLEIARVALAAGDQVVATVRSQPTQLVATLHNHPELYVVPMDVTQEDQVRVAVNALHGNQPGDPKKFAQVILQLANTDHPPLHLPVGKDAVSMYQNNAAKMAQEIAAWLPVATSTDHNHRIAASTLA